MGSEYEVFLKYIVVILGVLELFGCFERCCFLDLLVVLGYAYLTLMDDLSKDSLRYIWAAGFCSFIFDLTWIIIGMDKYTFIVFFATFFLKVPHPSLLLLVPLRRLVLLFKCTMIFII